MTFANFAIALRSFARRRPFQPFVLEFVSGDRFEVHHPEAVLLRGEIAYYVGHDRRVKLFDSESVCQLCDEPVPAPAAGTNGDQ